MRMDVDGVHGDSSERSCYFIMAKAHVLWLAGGVCLGVYFWKARSIDLVVRLGGFNLSCVWVNYNVTFKNILRPTIIILDFCFCWIGLNCRIVPASPWTGIYPPRVLYV